MYFPKASSTQTEPLLQTDAQHGRPLDYDPTFKGVRRDARSFHDIIFGILFILFVAAMGVISFIAFTQGDPKLLVPSNEFAKTGQSDGQLWFQDAVAYLKRDYDVMLGSLGFTIVLAVVWIQLMRLFTKLFI